MQKAGLDEAQAGIKTARRNINKLRYADDTTLIAESEEEEPLDESERGECKNWWPQREGVSPLSRHSPDQHIQGQEESSAR